MGRTRGQARRSSGQAQAAYTALQDQMPHSAPFAGGAGQQTLNKRAATWELPPTEARAADTAPVGRESDAWLTREFGVSFCPPPAQARTLKRPCLSSGTGTQDTAHTGARASVSTPTKSGASASDAAMVASSGHWAPSSTHFARARLGGSGADADGSTGPALRVFALCGIYGASSRLSHESHLWHG